ncbi:MAG: hypothetical protein JRK53_14100 [Deltaproteobacteria bacterium]|nr:hypothetical protein [Deltaproteobacteria bacterium]
MFTGKLGKWLVVAMVVGAVFMCPVAVSVADAQCYASEAFYHLDEMLLDFTWAYYYGLIGYPCDAADYVYYAYLEAYDAFIAAYYAYYTYYDSDSYYLFESAYYAWAYMSTASLYADDGCWYGDYTSFVYGAIYSIISMQYVWDAVWYAYWTGVYWEYYCYY